MIQGLIKEVICGCAFLLTVILNAQASEDTDLKMSYKQKSFCNYRTSEKSSILKDNWKTVVKKKSRTLVFIVIKVSILYN